MAKLLSIDIDQQNDEFLLIGINSFIKDYQMTALLNDTLNLKLSLTKSENEYGLFSIYKSQNSAKAACLIHNQSSSGTYAFDKLKSFEYLFLISNFDKSQVHEILSNQQDIIYFSELDAEKILKREFTKLKSFLD